MFELLFQYWSINYLFGPNNIFMEFGTPFTVFSEQNMSATSLQTQKWRYTFLQLTSLVV